MIGMSLEAWATIASGLLISFTIGISWGRMRSDLHAYAERLTAGFDRNDASHEVMTGSTDNAHERLREVEKHLERLDVQCRFRAGEK